MVVVVVVVGLGVCVRGVWSSVGELCLVHPRLPPPPISPIPAYVEPGSEARGEWLALVPAVLQLAAAVAGQGVRVLVAVAPLSGCAPCLQALQNARRGSLILPDLLADGLVSASPAGAGLVQGCHVFR